MTKAPAFADRDLFLWMDAMRSLAALAVVVSHARDLMMRDYAGPALFAPFYAATGLGHSGVVVFFVLSGFWISRAVLARLDQPSFWPGYLIDRLSRLLIVLVPALVIGGLCDWLGANYLGLPIYSGAAGPHSIEQPVAQQLGAWGFIGNLLFLQTILVPAWGSNGPLWSLAYEFWYYVWFPALALLLIWRKAGVALLALAVALANPEIAIGFASWLVGLALLQRLERKPLAAYQNRTITILAVGLFFGALLTSGSIKFVGSDFLLALCFGLFLLALTRGQVRFPAFLALLATFGRQSSFSLYAIHFPVLALAAGLSLDGERLAPSAVSIGLVLALTSLCIGLGWVFSRLTERHTAALRDWLRARLGVALTTSGDARLP